MLDIPPLLAVDQPPLLSLCSHRLGGCSKSFMGQLLIDAGCRSALNLDILENDSQRIYDAYGHVQHILLPPTDTIVHDPIADLRVHAGLDRAILKSDHATCIIYDCAAGALNRHTYVVDQLDIGLRLNAMERHCLVLVPTSARDDIAREAIATFEVWRELLPHPHRVVPVVSQRDGDIHNLPKGHDLHTLMKLATDGAFLLPRIPMSILNDIRRSGLTLYELADTSNPLATAAMAAEIGLDPTIVQLMRRAAGSLLSETDPQMVRLGFPLGL